MAVFRFILNNEVKISGKSNFYLNQIAVVKMIKT